MLGPAIIKSNRMTLLQHLEKSRFRRLTTLFIFAPFFSLVSCIPTEKMTLLQSDSPQSEALITTLPGIYKLQQNDIIDVRISSINPEINELFNQPNLGAAQVAQATAQTGGDLFFMTGYSVNDSGNVDIPFIGKVQVLGLQLAEAHAAIDSAVSALFSNYHLQVRMGGIRFAALGEVNRPGKQVVMQHQVTILEALALAGDFSNVADRSQVRLVRQNPEGTRIHTINLLNQDIIESPVYFIQPNDVLYIPPLRQRSWGVGITGAETLSAVVGTLSTSLALILSIISLSQ